MLALLSLLLGIILGVVGFKIYIGTPKGTILMHTQEEPGEPPSLLLELNERPEILYDYDWVIFKVSHR